jgi:hypothetical protein
VSVSTETTLRVISGALIGKPTMSGPIGRGAGRNAWGYRSNQFSGVGPATSLCVARRAKHPNPRSTHAIKNMPLYRNSETAYVSRQPGPRKRGVSRSSRTRAGRRWTLVTSARTASQGATVSEAAAHTTGVIGVRQNRVVLAPGVCAPSVAVMWVARPGTRISHPQGDGGNSASLPGESTT